MKNISILSPDELFKIMFLIIKKIIILQFRHRVNMVSPMPNGKWKISVTDLKQQKTSEYYFDAVVVCIGWVIPWFSRYICNSQQTYQEFFNKKNQVDKIKIGWIRVFWNFIEQGLVYKFDYVFFFFFFTFHFVNIIMVILNKKSILPACVMRRGDHLL